MLTLVIKVAVLRTAQKHAAQSRAGPWKQLIVLDAALCGLFRSGRFLASIWTDTCHVHVATRAERASLSARTVRGSPCKFSFTRQTSLPVDLSLVSVYCPRHARASIKIMAVNLLSPSVVDITVTSTAGRRSITSLVGDAPKPIKGQLEHP